DYSKCAVDPDIMDLLFRLARESGLEGWRDAMFGGEPINVTEGRAVLHTALRNRTGRPVYAGSGDVMPEINAVLAAMAVFAEGVRAGTIAGATGRRFTDIVNIGIGGSDLGPAMATLALAPCHDGPRAHYVS